MTDGRLIIVTGMHRSGTSLAAQLLFRAGVPLGAQLVEKNKFNPHGYFEDAHVVAIHDRLLDGLKRPWGSLDHSFPLPENWLTGPSGKMAGDELAGYLSGLIEQIGRPKTMAVKDPRAALFLPLWKDVADRLRLELRTVICTRSVDAVAASLARRDSFPASVSTMLWHLYNASAIRDCDPETSLILPFENWRSDPDGCLKRLLRFAGPGLKKPNGDLIDRNLGKPANKKATGSAIRWQNAFKACKPDFRPSGTLNKLASAFFEHAAVFSPWLDFADNSELAETMSRRIAGDLANYRAAYSELEQKIAALTESSSENAAIRARLVELQANNEALEATVRNLESDLAAARDAIAYVENSAGVSIADFRKLEQQSLDNMAAYKEMDARYFAALRDMKRIEIDLDRHINLARENYTAYKTIDERHAVTVAKLEAKKSENDRLQRRLMMLQISRRSKRPLPGGPSPRRRKATRKAKPDKSRARKLAR